MARLQGGHFLFDDDMKALPVLSMTEANKKCTHLCCTFLSLVRPPQCGSQLVPIYRKAKRVIPQGTRADQVRQLVRDE